MTNQKIYNWVEEVEYLTRYSCLEADDDSPHSLVKIYTEAIGKMGEANALLSRLMDEMKEEERLERMPAKECPKCSQISFHEKTGKCFKCNYTDKGEK